MEFGLDLYLYEIMFMVLFQLYDKSAYLFFLSSVADRLWDAAASSSAPLNDYLFTVLRSKNLSVWQDSRDPGDYLDDFYGTIGKQFSEKYHSLYKSKKAYGSANIILLSFDIECKNIGFYLLPWFVNLFVFWTLLFMTS